MVTRLRCCFKAFRGGKELAAVYWSFEVCSTVVAYSDLTYTDERLLLRPNGQNPLSCQDVEV